MEITRVTRRDVLDYLKIYVGDITGRLDELDFFERVYDLENLESTDPRYNTAKKDIIQHRYNNPEDWDALWFYEYSPFSWLNCDDSTFLNLLTQVFHPEVYGNDKKRDEHIKTINEYLRSDGFELGVKYYISERPVYRGKKISVRKNFEESTEYINKKLGTNYISRKTQIMIESIDKSPETAIGTAKELVETCCKEILRKRGKELNIKWSFTTLVKQTNEVLSLTPESVSKNKKATDSIKKILGSISTIINEMNELRNHYGSGHGKEATFRGLQVRHAKFVVGLATDLAIFLFETHEEKHKD